MSDRLLGRSFCAPEGAMIFGCCSIGGYISIILGVKGNPSSRLYYHERYHLFGLIVGFNLHYACGLFIYQGSLGGVLTVCGASLPFSIIYQKWGGADSPVFIPLVSVPPGTDIFYLPLVGQAPGEAIGPSC